MYHINRNDVADGFVGLWEVVRFVCEHLPCHGWLRPEAPLKQYWRRVQSVRVRLLRCRLRSTLCMPCTTQSCITATSTTDSAYDFWRVWYFPGQKDGWLTIGISFTTRPPSPGVSDPDVTIPAPEFDD